LFGASVGCIDVQSGATDEALKPLEHLAQCNVVQSGAAGYMVAAEGLEPPTPRV
jgi:hypothetical protein